jgi:hypothetical protein
MSNTTARATRRHRFVIIDQRAVEDTRLSWAAQGLLACLLSRPDDWKVLVNDLRKRGDVGRDGIYRLLRELRNAGYAKFVRSRDEQGRIRGGTYLVQEIATSPHPDLPYSAEPETVMLESARPEALPKTSWRETQEEPTRQTTTNNRHAVKSFMEFPPWVPEELPKPAQQQVATLDARTAQSVVDEWAVLLELGAIRSSPIGYLRSLVMRAQTGDFHPKYTKEMAELRESEEA